MGSTDCVLVMTTWPADASAAAFATMLVQEGLAACVNLQADMDSIYTWKGKVEQDRERQVLIKTTVDRLPALEARIGELHPYELPELVAIPIVAGSRAYLDWVREATSDAR